MQDEPKINKTTLILLSLFVVLSSFVLIFYGDSSYQIGGLFMLLVFGIILLITSYQKKQKNK